MIGGLRRAGPARPHLSVCAHLRCEGGGEEGQRSDAPADEARLALSEAVDRVSAAQQRSGKLRPALPQTMRARPGFAPADDGRHLHDPDLLGRAVPVLE